MPEKVKRSIIFGSAFFLLRFTLYVFGPVSGHLDGAEEGRGLGFGFAVLLFGDRVGDDSGAGLDAADAVFDDGHSYGDRDVQVSGRVEIADRAPLDASARGLELVDDFHRPDLRRARQGSRRETE